VNKEIKYSDTPLEETKSSLLEGGFDPLWVDAQLDLFKALTTGFGGEVTSILEQLINVKPETFSQYVISNKQNFT